MDDKKKARTCKIPISSEKPIIDVQVNSMYSAAITGTLSSDPAPAPPPHKTQIHSKNYVFKIDDGELYTWGIGPLGRKCVAHDKADRYGF